MPLVYIFIIVFYFSILLIISYFTGKKADNQSFFLGNRKSPWYVVGFGMIGSLLSGVTFISVPGWVGATNFSYMQMVFGYFFGYMVIAHVLLPLYYRLNLTSIYTYLEQRFGQWTYKTGASLFLVSRMIGSAFRLFLVANVLQVVVFDYYNIPFWVTIVISILLIWLYTNKGGIKTIVWTDCLQTFSMLASVVITVVLVSNELSLDGKSVFHKIADSSFSKLFYFEDWHDKRHFVKQFFSGFFIAIVMSGLDQDIIQKNLSCKSIKDAQKNVYFYGIALIPVNLLFLSLGVLLYLYAAAKGIEVPANSDNLYPMLATGGYMPVVAGVFFVLGLISAAYSSADSALTALTTSFTVDILDSARLPDDRLKKVRGRVHIFISFILAVCIFIFKLINNQAVVSAVFQAAGYTYGPLLGLYAFGLFTKRSIWDKATPFIAIISPLLCWLLDANSVKWFNGYRFGFEILMLNGFFTIFMLAAFSKRIKKDET